jgi:hypothetical protein
MLAMATSASAASVGDANAGDVWVDNVGQPAGPGHEMDPHLQCTDINLWGSGLADSSGTFTIDGWSPSGRHEQDYSATWSSTGGKAPQVIAVIDVQKLIKQAAANGDTPAAQGYHFKLEFSQDPQKHKTFWVNCPAPTTSPPGTPPSGSPPGSPPPGKPPVLSTNHHRHHKHHKRHLVKPTRHHRVRARHVHRKLSPTPPFTG